MATITNWNPYGVALNVTATGSNVKRTSATQFTVSIAASWETYWSSNKTNFGMKASSGGQTKALHAFGTKSGGTSGTFTGTYSISGNGSATKTITVAFTNYEENSTGTVTKSATKNVTFNVSVPAWTSYTISYNANGGTGAPASQTKWKDQTLTLSSTKPTRTGHAFQGWATSATATTAQYTAGAKYTANAATTLYAVWKANTYTVKFDANGGTGAPSNQTKTYGATLKLSSVIPTRDRYNFLGWATSASATSATYVASGDYTANSAITLYAVWELAYVRPRIKNLTVERCSQVVENSYSRLVYKDGSYTSWYISDCGTDPRGIEWNVTEATLNGTTLTCKCNYDVYTDVTFTVSGIDISEEEVANIKTINAAVVDFNEETFEITIDIVIKIATILYEYESDDTGEYMRIKFDWECDAVDVTPSYGDRVIQVDVGEHSHVEFFAEFSGSVNQVMGGDLSTDVTYSVKVTVADPFDSTKLTVTLPGQHFAIDVMPENKGISFNKPAELEGVADFDFTIYPRQGFMNIPIGENANFNNLKIPGTYISYDKVATTYVNCPVTSGTFTLEVASAGNEGQIRQRVQYCSKTGSMVYERYYYGTNEDDDLNWSDWYEAGGQKSVMTVGLSDNTTIGVVNTYTQMPFNKKILSLGYNLSLSGNSVVIGKYVRHVKISGQTRITCGSVAGHRHARLCKSSNGTVSYITWTNIKMDSSDQNVLTFTPIIVDVSEGDILYMVFYTPDSTDVNSAGSSSNGYATYMTVESL